MTRLAVILLAAASLHSNLGAAGAEAPADLARKARAVLEKHCYPCHGKDGKAEAGVFVLSRHRLIDRKNCGPSPAGPGSSRRSWRRRCRRRG